MAQEKNNLDKHTELDDIREKVINVNGKIDQCHDRYCQTDYRTLELVEL